MPYHPIIGLEIHIELSTKSKMFCGCDAHWQQYEPNTNTCPVCLGMPGALPVPNKQAIEYTLQLAQALSCQINLKSHFDRKHYFYPDLPKGYQISQYDEPFGVRGEVSTYVRDEKTGTYTKKSFRIHRVHLEEDTGKLSHVGGDTIVDFNRSSVPLVEIVTEADFRSSDDVKAFLQELHAIVRTIGVSDADIEHGSMRMEPNISVKEYQIADAKNQNERLDPKDLPKYKVEVKNINSFTFVKRAIDYEVKRHTELLERGETPAQETRGWDDQKQLTYSQRTKENAQDYRYFPDPDIPAFEFTSEYVASLKDKLPELPMAKVERYVHDLKIKIQDAITLTRESESAQYYESVLSCARAATSTLDPQTVANLIINKKLSTDLTPDEFAKQASELTKPKETDMQLLAQTISTVLAANPKSVADYQSGKTTAVMYLVGQVMKLMKGQAEAVVVKQKLEETLGTM